MTTAHAQGYTPVELFVSDPHGEYEEFSHIMRGGCGIVRAEIDAAFGAELDEASRSELATLVCYPEEKIALLGDKADSYLPQLGTLVDRFLAKRGINADVNYASLADMCKGIQELAVDEVHLVGDVYDRGPAPDKIMDGLAEFPRADIQWGNHDIVWMGAAMGQPGCIGNVVRNAARYASLSVLDEAYDIDLQLLRDFANTAYADDPCVGFALKGEHPELSPEELMTTVRIQKAMAIIQFKVEGQLIDNNPSFGLEDRKLLHKIDVEHAKLEVDGVVYDIVDTVFPTIDWDDPYRLTEQEAAVMAQLQAAFKGSERLQRHMDVFFERGSLYKISGKCLMLHACVPLNEDGSLMEVDLYGKTYKGKALFDIVDEYVRDAHSATELEDRKRGADLLWYLWLGQGSPLFAKSKMATLEIYLIEDKAARVEVKNAFYRLYENEQVIAGIFEDFGMDPKTSHIVCGHVPVKVKDGENPIKCGGKVIDIDGGMSMPYQKNTGIAGFTLVSDANGLKLYAHQTFAGRTKAIRENADLASTVTVVE